MSSKPDYTSDDIMFRQGGSIDERRAADEELHKFCFKTLNALVHRERFDDSSLKLVCRLDISLIWSADGTLNYFVNEVERGIAVCFFGNVETDYLVDRVADELGPLLVKWITRKKSEISQRS